MWKVWLAALLNFFLPGAGYLLLGHQVALSLLWLVGVIGLTWVEFSIQAVAPQAYMVMFASVLLMNAAFAIDAWRIGRMQVDNRGLAPA